jgi:hypothetical protein
MEDDKEADDPVVVVLIYDEDAAQPEAPTGTPAHLHPTMANLWRFIQRRGEATHTYYVETGEEQLHMPALVPAHISREKEILKGGLR